MSLSNVNDLYRCFVTWSSFIMGNIITVLDGLNVLFLFLTKLRKKKIYFSALTNEWLY